MADKAALGVTTVLSYQEPTDEEIAVSDRLSLTIQKMNIYEDDNGMAKRTELVTCIARLVQKWVSNVAVGQGKDRHRYGSTALVFGGQALGVVTKDSDIDIVCVVPSFVPRAEFFTTFVEVLNTEATPAPNTLRMVTGARVPIIQISLMGIEIDLCLSCLSMEVIPENIDYSDDTVLEGMDVTDVRSLNGVREIRNVEELLPNLATFCSTLKAIKLWAKARGIHASAQGYPGGIVWTIMLARVCQQYPHATPATLLHKFFKIYSNWKWPSPVTLTAQNRKDPYKLKPWNLKVNPGDKNHVMPVITPAYPEKNCASALNKSALHVVTRQISLALDLVKRIEISMAPWEELFVPLDFFSMYKHFLMVIAKSEEPSHHEDWSGLVQARSRLFVESLEQQASIKLVHAHPKSYHQGCTTKWFWGLEFVDVKGIKLNLADDLHSFQEHLLECATDRGFHKPGMVVHCYHVRRKDLQSVLP